MRSKIPPFAGEQYKSTRISTIYVYMYVLSIDVRSVGPGLIVMTSQGPLSAIHQSSSTGEISEDVAYL